MSLGTNRQAAAISVERLEDRTLLANLAITNGILIDGSATQVDPPVIGERIRVRTFFDTSALASSAKYRIAFDIDGVELSRTDETFGAGQSSGSFFRSIEGWYAEPGTHTVTITLDADNQITEDNENDNVFTFTYTPVRAIPPVKFISPLDRESFTEHRLGNYVDLDPRTDIIRDWKGGSVTYDGHDGVDFGAPHFAQMDEGQPVVAAADGVVVSVDDVGFDRNVGTLDNITPGGPPNIVRIDHGQGWQTIYIHLRRDSIRVQPGQNVQAGERIGWEGSSGDSTRSHLHFEVQHNGLEVETFLDPTAYWISPPPYVLDANPALIDSAITNYDVLSPVNQLTELPNPFREFSTDAGQRVRAINYYSSLNAGDVIQAVFFEPNGMEFDRDTINITEDFSSSRWVFARTLPDSPAIGEWKVEYFANGIIKGTDFFNVTPEGSPAIRVDNKDDGQIARDDRFTPFDLGTVAVGENAPTQSFTVVNHGADVLFINQIVVPTGFSIVNGLPSQLAVGQSDELVVSLSTTQAGYFSGQLRIATNDPDRSEYNLTLEGTVTSATETTLRLGLGTRSIVEGVEGVGNVRRPAGPNSQPLSVALTVDDGSEISVPTSVTIPANQDYAIFFFDALFDGENDPNQTVEVTATATGFTTAINTVDVENGENFDYGDAPNTFLTSEAVDGAKHLATGPTLGLLRDSETNANIPLDGSGDDVNGSSDDEDGVTVPVFNIGVPGTIDIDVQGIMDSAVVQGWFDLNRNGVFDHPSEQIVNETLDENGTVQFSFTALEGTGGVTFVRFRVSSAGGLTPSGTASDGEVEDHRVIINSPPTIAGLADPPVIKEDGSSSPISFSISDPETSVTQLDVSGTSSNTTLIPNANIIFGGEAVMRTVTVTPAANQFGSAIITVQVTDADGAFAQKSFNITVLPVNDAPEISEITNQTVAENGSSGPVGFSIDDTESAASALTLNATSSDPTLVPASNIVFGGSGANRTVTVTPATNQTGSATIIVTTTDEQLLSTQEIFQVNVGDGLPTLTDIADQVTNEGVPTSPIPLTIGDDLTPVDNLTIDAVSSNPLIILNADIVITGTGANRTVTITPVAGQSGISTITLTVTDLDGKFASDTFLVTVVSLNTPPTISEINNQSVLQNTATGEIAFSVGDQETSPDSITLTGSSGFTSLVPTQNIVFGGSGASRTVQVTPVNNRTGAVVITITATDPGGQSTTEFFLLTVGNHAPTISNIVNLTTNEDTTTPAIAFGVSDIDNASGDLVLSGTSSNTDLVADANIVFGGNNSVRTVTVTPTPNQFGMTTITVTVSDPAGATATDTFDLTFNSVNDLPTITDIANQTVEEDTPTSSLLFTIDDVETTTGTLTVTATSTDPLLFPTNRILLVGNAGNRTVTLTPGDNEFGSATITLTVTDLDGGTASTSFDVTVNGGNDDPTITNIADQMTDEDIPIESLPVTIGDDETATGSLTLSATSSNPTVVPLGNIVFGGSAANRTVTISPESNASGTSTITITVEDEEGSTASTTFEVEVADLNDSPIVSQISDQLININTFIDAISLTISDVETPVDSLTIMFDSSNTALIANDAITLNGSGNDRSITITPTADQVGLATITINVADPDGATTTRTFDVTVNSLPTITEIADQMIDEDESTGALDFSVTDLETAAGSLQIALETTNTILFPAGSIVIDGTGSARTVTATPHPNRSGTSEIIITVDDGFGGIVVESFEVTVIPFNDSPLVSAIGDQTTNEDQPIVGVEFIVSDGDSPAGLLTLEATSSNPTLITNADIGFGVIAGGVGDGANRTISLFPGLNQSGTATITVTVRDPQGATATTTFDFTVSPFNDAPQISGIADQEIGESSSTVPIDFTVTDPETGPDGITITVSSNNSVLVPESSIVVNGVGLNRTVTVIPVADHIGRAEVTLTVTGPDAAMTTETFVINVTPVIGDLVFDAPIDNGPNTILLRRDGSILQVINEATGQVVASRRLGSTIGIIINGAADEDDQLTVDLKSGGLILVPGGIQFNGGAGGNDVLIIAEASFATVTYAASGVDNGSITFEAIEEIIEIAYTGLEPIIDNSNADDRIFQDIPGRNSQIRVLDDSIPNNNKLTIDANGSGGFESVTFVSPRVSLTINASDGDDVVQILPLDELFTAVLQVNGGSGNDTLDASTTDRSVTLAGEEGADSILGGRASDLLDGGADDDTVKGGPSDDTIHGGAGDDVIRGQAGRDQIFGNDGDDREYGGSGSDMLNGGDGNDRLFGQGGTNDSLTGGTGTDMLNGGAGRDWVVAIADEDFVLNDLQVKGNGTDQLVSIERADITGGVGDNRIDATQFSGKTILSGAGGDDTILGSDQNDTINGGDGDDVIAGNRGRDQLFGDAGNDTINGGFGRDTIRGGDGNDGLAGSRGNDKISGNAGDDTILGDENNDSLFGGGGDDIIIGGSDNDKLSGQGGDFDTLVGGSGIGPDPGDRVDGDETEIDETFTFFADWVDATV